MMSLSEHHYSSSVLLIYSFDFGEENVDLQIEDLTQIFSRFTEVRVLDSDENRILVSKYSLRNLLFAKKEDFSSRLSKFEFRVLHFGTYFRKYKDLSFLTQFFG